MDVLKKFQEATADSTPCDLFDDLSPITRLLNCITVWIANRLKGHKKRGDAKMYPDGNTTIM